MKIYGIILLIFFFLDTQGQLLSGRVTYADGNSVIGASVWIKEKGGAVGGVTDLNGNYNIEIDSTCLTICASYFDCFTECLKIDNRKVINITLKEGPVELTNIEVIAHLDRKHEILTIEKIAEDSTFLFKYICDNIEYPLHAINSGVQGKVLAKFKIDSTDYSCSVNIIRGIDNLIDNNVREAILSFSDWESLILTDEMNKKTISPDIFGFSFWLRTEREYILPIIFTIKSHN